jgi:hypothetical protein
MFDLIRLKEHFVCLFLSSLFHSRQLRKSNFLFSQVLQRMFLVSMLTKQLHISMYFFTNLSLCSVHSIRFFCYSFLLLFLVSFQLNFYCRCRVFKKQFMSDLSNGRFVQTKFIISPIFLPCYRTTNSFYKTTFEFWCTVVLFLRSHSVLLLLFLLLFKSLTVCSIYRRL